MGKLVVGHCSVCGKRIASRTRNNFIKKVGKHFRTEHPLAFSRRIKDGKRLAAENPSLQDFMDALQSSPRAALRIYSQWTERQYQDTKRVMDALETVLPIPMVASWKFIEAAHDGFEGLPR